MLLWTSAGGCRLEDRGPFRGGRSDRRGGSERGHPGELDFQPQRRRIRLNDFNAKVRAALDRDKLREFAKHEGFLEDAFIFSKFCASVVWWGENLALEMAELFVPTAQQVLAKDPVEGFHELSHDFASTVLRVFDVLHVYVGELKPTRRQWTIARRMSEKIDPKRVAEHISTVRPRHFQWRASSSISSASRHRGNTKRSCANSIGRSWIR